MVVDSLLGGSWPKKTLPFTALPHDVDDTTTKNSDRDKDYPPNTPGPHEAEGDIQQLTPMPENNTEGL